MEKPEKSHDLISGTVYSLDLPPRHWCTWDLSVTGFCVPVDA